MAMNRNDIINALACSLVTELTSSDDLGEIVDDFIMDRVDPDDTSDLAREKRFLESKTIAMDSLLAAARMVAMFEVEDYD